MGMCIRLRRKRLKWTQAEIAERAGVARSLVSRIELGRDDKIEVAPALRVLNALELDVEVRARNLTFVPVPPTRLDELGLSPSTLAAFHSAGLREVAQMPTLEKLVARRQFRSGEALFEAMCALSRHGIVVRGGVVPEERELEMLKLRIVDGLTLKAIGERYGVIGERVRQLLAAYFGLHGVPPAATGSSRRRRRDS